MSELINEATGRAGAGSATGRDYASMPGTSAELLQAALDDIITTLQGKVIYCKDLAAISRGRYPARPATLEMPTSISSSANSPLRILSSYLTVYWKDRGAIDIQLGSLMLDTSGLIICIRKPEEHKVVKHTPTINQVSMIASEAQIAIDARKAEEDEAARIAAEEAEAAAAAKEERRAARARAKAAEAELAAAYDSGDTETIERLHAEFADEYNRYMDMVSTAASEAAADVATEIEAAPITEEDLPEDLDRMSFIYGWLAANVDFMYAKLPGWDRKAEYCFTKRYPDAVKAAVAGAPGYTITDKDKRTSGGYLAQFANEYHVHFKNGAIPKAPEIVKSFLSSIKSLKTGEASQIKANISSNALAQYLIMNLDFAFDLTANTNAYTTCRNMADNKEHFDLGYNWTGTRKSTRRGKKLTASFNPAYEAETNPFEQEFATVERVQASDYDQYPTDQEGDFYA